MKSIIEQAVHLEVTAEANYRKAAQATSDPAAREILELLATEEAEHAEALRGMRGVETLRSVPLLERARAWIQGTVEGGMHAISPDAALLDVLRRAMDIERTTETFYREQQQLAEDPKITDLFSRLADIEKTHFLFVGSLVEYFNRPNEWIEDAEFGIRDEY